MKFCEILKTSWSPPCDCFCSTEKYFPNKILKNPLKKLKKRKTTTYAKQNLNQANKKSCFLKYGWQEEFSPWRPQIYSFYLIGKKSVGKKWRIFALVTNIFYRRIFLPTNNFYRRIGIFIWTVFCILLLKDTLGLSTDHIFA